MNNKGFKLGTVIIIILLTSILSAVTTGVIINNNYEGSSGLTYAEIMNDENLSEFLTIYSEIKNNFYGEYDEVGMLSAAATAMVDYEGNDSGAMQVALDAMLEYLGDDYTSFLDQSQSDYLAEELAGTYEGVGITITGNEIIGVTKDSPAEDAGILIGDIIISINEQKITYDNSSFISYIISSSEDIIDLIVLRGDTELTFNVYKTTLDSSTKYYMIEDTTVGYVSLSVFSDNSYTSFNNAIDDLETNGMESLIIDLRNNGGGYLDKALEIASIFLNKGDVINSLVSNDGKTYNYDETTESRDYDIIILMNSESASASEILAAALKDNGLAKIVGTQSYGKGTVQQLIESVGGTSAKYTTAYWYTPNEICINNVGISPDYYIELEYITNDEGEYTAVIDSQYNKAIEILTGA